MRLNMVIALLCLVLLLIGFLQVFSRRYRPPQAPRFPALKELGKLERCRERYRRLCARHAFPDRVPNAHLVALKSKRTLFLFSGAELLERYTIGLGPNPEGPKIAEGDGRTPLGDYSICGRDSESEHYLYLQLNYPNAQDAEKAYRQGRIPREQFERIRAATEEKRPPPSDTALGGPIGIHGGDAQGDWTDGSLALRNEAMEEIWYVAQSGAPVSIQE